jgi:hypothetical protein
MATIQPRGLCPVCRREMALLSDHTVARPHKDGRGEPCAGYGLEGQLIPPPPPERIRVQQSVHSKRWRVWVGDRLAYVCDGYETACRRAGELAELQRERAVEAESLALHAERFGDGRTA